ncbi:MAG: hypothetical protein IT324_10425 [Anaerolineae bacterium]|nr:hypothetical protein [Anaerolineae bacterium]
MSRELRELETLLRQNEDELIGLTAQQFQGVSNLNQQQAAYIPEGVRFLHDLVVVAVALYPSDNWIRESYRWASNPSGVLMRSHIGYKQQAELLRAYFAAARDTLHLQEHLRQLLNAVEQLMFGVMTEMYESDRQSARTA